MSDYTADFARAYELLWSGFARQVGGTLIQYFKSVALEQMPRRVLDLCCGTGQLARTFAEEGFTVVGIDLSEAMLAHARRNTEAYAERVTFMQGDAANFSLDAPVGFAVSTYNALNELPDESALRACFACVRAALVEGGTFVFDLKTRAGLAAWTQLSLRDTETATILMRGTLRGDHASNRITTFLREDDGRYTRVDFTLENTVFAFDLVLRLLQETGWRSARVAGGLDLSKPLHDPEKQDRVYVVAQK